MQTHSHLFPSHLQASSFSGGKSNMSKCVKLPLNQIPGFLYQPLFPTLSLPFSEIQKRNCKVFALSKKQKTASSSRQSQAVSWLDQTLAANNYSSFPFHSPGGTMLLLLSAKQYLAPCKSIKNLREEREMRPLTSMHVLVLLAML